MLCRDGPEYHRQYKNSLLLRHKEDQARIETVAPSYALTIGFDCFLTLTSHHELGVRVTYSRGNPVDRTVRLLLACFTWS